MAYVPQNRIKTNLYTSGGEYQLEINGEEYIGFYHRYYTGEVFTERTPQDTNRQVLEEIQVDQLGAFNIENRDQIYIASFINDPDPPLDQTTNPSVGSIEEYFNATGKNKRELSRVRIAPSFYFATPTEKEYRIEEFTRYFCKKTNEQRYIEISKNYYNKLVDRTSDSLFELYIPIRLPWRIAGNKNQVETVNKNLTQLTEQRLKIKGLQQFLKYDYLKFYKES